MNPLDKKAAFTQIKVQFGEANNITLVAPYFGKGACDSLGLDPNAKHLTIFCDLLSGACNPYEVEKLLGSNVDLRTVDNLHAKIYLTDNFVLIGSANPSANGLGFEGSEVTGLIEACVSSSSSKIIGKWKTFVKLNIFPFSRTIVNSDLQAAKKLWKLRRNIRKRAESGKTLLAKMRECPEFFEDKDIALTLCSYTELSPEARAEFHDVCNKVNMASLGCYEGWPKAIAGTRVIDFYYDQGKIIYNGLWQIMESGSLGKSTSITLCNEIENLEGLDFPSKEQVEVTHLLESWLLRYPGLIATEEVDFILSAFDFAHALQSGSLPDEIKLQYTEPWVNRMDIVNCVKSSNDILEHSVYICPASGGSYKHKRCRYFGMYRNRRVELVSEIEAVVDVNLNKGKTDIKWINVRTPNIRKRAESAAARLRPNAGAVRVFLLGELCPTDFEKDSPGPMRMSKRYVDITSSQSNSAGELASFLAKRKWTDMGI